jgi:pimeloyl-ACP methyl ester carboxylesterase
MFLQSADGTALALEKTGTGPPVILIDGAFGHRSFGPNKNLPALLADRFTVIAYDRRGKGKSGDTPPWTVEREIEDLEAMLTEAGGRACVYGPSSGAALALEAARRGLAIERLVLFEAPFVVDASRPPIPADIADHLTRLIAENKRGAAVRLFMTHGVALSPLIAATLRFTPGWSGMKATAHTLPYDTAILDAATTGAGKPLPPDRWASVVVPTLVLDGSKSPEWMRNAMQALAAVLPNAEHRSLQKQWHFVKPEAIAPVLREFFGDASRGESSDGPGPELGDRR